MFALAEEILGGRRVTVLCADGETRMARIPGKMRRRQWVREGDLIIVWPWDFQDSKADVKHRYTKTQAMYLSRKQVLPDVVDMFGMNSRSDEDDIGDDLFGSSGAAEEAVEETDDDDGDVDDMFGSDEDDDDVDDMFGSDEDDDDVDDMLVQMRMKWSKNNRLSRICQNPNRSMMTTMMTTISMLCSPERQSIEVHRIQTNGRGVLTWHVLAMTGMS